MKKVVFIFLIVAKTLVLPSQINDDYLLAYKNPKLLDDTYDCGRIQPGRFCNHHRYIKNKVEVEDIDNLIAKLSSKLDCVCSDDCLYGESHENVGISLYSPLDTTNLSKDHYFKAAENFRIKWKIGSCKNDLLILIDPENKKIVMSMGKNAKKAIPINSLMKINEKMQSTLMPENVYEVIRNLTESYYVELWNIKHIPGASSRATPNLLFLLIALSVINLLICFTCLMCFIGRRKCKRRSREDGDGDGDFVESNLSGPFACCSRHTDNEDEATTEVDASKRKDIDVVNVDELDTEL